MTMSADTALRQAYMTAHDYTLHAVSDLCKHLEIDRRSPGWRKQLEPFAPVLAAMIAACAKDFETAVMSGSVDGIPGPAIRLQVESVPDSLIEAVGLLTEAVGALGRESV